MIEIIMTRLRGSENIDLGTRHEEPLKAFDLMVGCELKWGARIIKCQPTIIETVTRVLHCIDTTIFQGTAEEMDILYQTCLYYMVAGKYDKINLEKSFLDLSQMSEGDGVLPLHAFMADGMLFGQNRLKIALILGHGIIDKDEIKELLNHSSEDLLAAIQLRAESNAANLTEILT